MASVKTSFAGEKCGVKRLAEMAESALETQISPLLPGDQLQLVDLYAGATGPSLDFLITLQQHPTGCCWLLRQEACVVGASWFTYVKGEAELIDFVIAPSQRRQGLGLILLKGCLRRLRADSIASCHLEVRRSNCAAIGLYQKAGFVIVGQRANYYRGQDEAEDAILMRWQTDEGPAHP